MSCFDENTALQFAQGLLGADRTREVERHAADCAACRWLLAAASGAATQETLTTPDEGPAWTEAPAPDQILAGDYRIVRKIGSGGMGTVYEASHARIPRRFAVKLLVQGLDASSEAVARLRREAEITSRLSHPHIVEVLDFNTTEQGIPFVVMELLEGEPLGALLRRERVVRSVEQLSAIVRQASSALGAAHAQGVVHRDLKPNNLFLCRTDDGRVQLKVMDFGISKIVDSTTDLTRDTAVLGSPGYMSPEQARGQSAAVDWRADIFSMGAIIYRMLCGQTPFAADSVPATLYKVVHESPETPPEWRRVPRPLQRVVLRALGKKPSARQRSMQQLDQELQGALELCGRRPRPAAADHAPAAASTSLTELMEPARRPWLLIAALVVALAGAASAAYLALAPSSRGGEGPAVGRGETRAPPPPLAVAAAPAALTQPSDTTLPASDAGSRPAAAAGGDAAVDGPAPSRRRRRRPRRRHGWLTVQSKSVDGRYLWAEVYLDGRRIGRTPVVGRRLSSGAHQVQLRRAGFRAASRRVVLRPGARAVVSLVLSPQ